MDLAGSTAFKSRSGRELVSPSRLPGLDPGQYSLEMAVKSVADRSISSQVVSSHNVRATDGKLSFQSKSVRKMPLDIHGGSAPAASGLMDLNSSKHITPAPGAYSPSKNKAGSEYDLSTLAGAETMPSASLRSTSEQHPSLAREAVKRNVPGPGTYQPRDILLKPSIPNGMSSKTGRNDGRFVGDSALDVSQTDPSVGPGTYERHTGTLIDDVQKSVKRSSKLQKAVQGENNGVGFTSKDKQHRLPHEAPLVVKEQSAKPGPAHYGDAHKPRDMVAKAKASFNAMATTANKFGFGALSSREPNAADGRDLTSMHAPSDPGAYSLETDVKSVPHRSIASQMKRSNNARAANGKLAFGTQSARAMPTDIHGGKASISSGLADTKNPVITPAPGAYDPKVDEFGAEYDLSTLADRDSKPSASNKSKSEQHPSVATNLIRRNTPGPGTYQPLFTLVEDRIADPMQSSKTGRNDGRFVGDSALDVSQTDPSVGPGTYSPRNLMNGEKVSIKASVDERASTGDSWEFMSTTIKNLFAGFFANEVGEALQFGGGPLHALEC